MVQDAGEFITRSNHSLQKGLEERDSGEMITVRAGDHAS